MNVLVVRSHGGLTRAWPRWQGATVLQLFPYGWDLPDGSVLRERVYSGMAEAVNATYVRWVNLDVRNAHFRRRASACISQIAICC